MPFDNAPTVDTPVSLLIEAGIKLIERPEHWCRMATMVAIPNGGVGYCAWGAVRVASNGELAPEFILALHALNTAARGRYYRDIVSLNDDARTTHTMVLEVMREAVEIARHLNL